MATVTLPVVDLWISIKGTKMHALCIPLHKCHELAVNPLKWLRFLGYAIYGRQGYLSLSETGPPIEDYTGDIMAQVYYFVSNGKSESHTMIFANVIFRGTSSC